MITPVAVQYCQSYVLHFLTVCLVCFTCVRCCSLIRHMHKNFTCLANSATSSLNDSDEQTSPGPPASRGVHVASSHFSKINASNGNNGWLNWEEESWEHCLYQSPCPPSLSLSASSTIIRIKHQEIDLPLLRAIFIFEHWRTKAFWYLRISITVISIYARVIIVVIMMASATNERTNQ